MRAMVAARGASSSLATAAKIGAAGPYPSPASERIDVLVTDAVDEALAPLRGARDRRGARVRPATVRPARQAVAASSCSTAPLRLVGGAHPRDPRPPGPLRRRARPRAGLRGRRTVVAMPLAGAARRPPRQPSRDRARRSPCFVPRGGRRGARAVARVLCAPTFAYGATMGSLDVTMNAHGVAVERRYGRPILSGFHAAFSLGGLLGAALGAVAAAADLDVRAHVAVAVGRGGRRRPGAGRGAFLPAARTRRAAASGLRPPAAAPVGARRAGLLRAAHRGRRRPTGAPSTSTTSSAPARAPRRWRSSRSPSPWSPGASSATGRQRFGPSCSSAAAGCSRRAASASRCSSATRPPRSSASRAWARGWPSSCRRLPRGGRRPGSRPVSHWPRSRRWATSGSSRARP